MKLTTRVRAFFGRGLIKAMGVTWVPDWMRYGFFEPTFKALVREGYAANGAVFACVSALAFAFIEPVLKAYEEAPGGRTHIENHPLEKLLKHPNAQMGMIELLLFTIIYLAIGGNAYWYKVRSRSKRIVELWVLSDAQVKPIPGTTQLVDHYELDTGKGQPELIPASDIVHFKWLINPLKPWLGQAPLAAVGREVDTDNEVSRYLFTLLKNDAIPRLALVAPENQVIDDDTFKRMRERWMEKYSGDMRGLPAFLEGGMKVERIGLNLNELAFEGLHGVPETRIAAALRVPMIVAGLGRGLENATYSNQEGLEKSFTLRTLVPLWRMAEAEITADLLPEFDENEAHLVAFDTNTIVALAEDVKTKRQWALDALAAGAILVNEFRATVGLPRDPQGDVYLRGLNLNEVPSQVATKTGARPYSRKTTERAYESKRRAARAIGARRKVLAKSIPGLQKDLSGYFEQLSAKVRSRTEAQIKAAAGGEHKAKPKADSLVGAEDDTALEAIIKRWYVKVLELSWDTWNVELGADVAFDLTDPAVNKVLALAGARVKDINDTTRRELAVVLQYGEAHGWSIDDFVRGDPDQGIAGITDLVAETYSGRSEAIAITELGFAQNQATTGRYADAGVSKVLVLDNGNTDDDEPCVEANGAEWTLEEADANPLEHPRCTRAFGALFD